MPSTEYFLGMPASTTIQLFSATLGQQIPRDTYIPTLGAAVSSCPSSNFLSCVVAHDLTFRRWATAVNVKLMLPPDKSRGLPVMLGSGPSGSTMRSRRPEELRLWPKLREIWHFRQNATMQDRRGQASFERLTLDSSYLIVIRNSGKEPS